MLEERFELAFLILSFFLCGVFLSCITRRERRCASPKWLLYVPCLFLGAVLQLAFGPIVFIYLTVALCLVTLYSFFSE